MNIFVFQIELKPVMLTPKFLKKLQKGGTGNVRIEWCQYVTSFVIRVLKEVRQSGKCIYPSSCPVYQI